MDEKMLLVGLRHIPRVGAKAISNLLETFGSAAAIWQASRKELLTRTDFSDNFLEHFVSSRDALDLHLLWNRLQKLKISVVTIQEPEYPRNLKNIYNPPPVLFYQGSWEQADANALAIVGSRTATVYGKKAAELFAKELGDEKFTIVSGMARGIDSCAHQGSLKGSGRTIAVLGSGIDVIYPRENWKLAQEIVDRGVLVSEYPPGTPPHAPNFPARNRIISGLSLGVLVVEAAIRSGALITADFALEQGRDVFAVPGPILNPTSQGTNNLIKQGAKLVDRTEDILEEYGVSRIFSEVPVPAAHLALDTDEKLIYDLLNWESSHVEKIIQETKWPASKVNTILMFLEINGLIEQLPGKYFIKKTI